MGQGLQTLLQTQLDGGEQIFVADGIGLSWPFGAAAQYDSAWTKWETYNYMEQEGGGAMKDERIFGNTSQNIYFKAAYTMQTVPLSLTGWDSANAQLHCKQ